MQDVLYQNWLQETNADNLSHYTSHKEKEITSITVHAIQSNEFDNDGNRKPGGYYITYDYMHRRLDPACNVTHKYVPNIGKYPIPRPHYKVTHMSFGKEERKVDFVEGVETGYSIPWTKKNMLKIIKEIPLAKEGGKLSCGVSAANGMRFTVESIDALINSESFDELAHFGRIPNDAERSKWLNNGGTLTDQQRMNEFVRNQAQRGVQERPVTASEVKKLIQQQQQEASSANASATS